MEKKYEPSSFETKIYENWLEKGYFKANVNSNKKKFSIVMPPPNITSNLHMGHAFQETIQDIIIRRKRMQGYEALWLPGTDHAAIATEAKVVEKLAKQGLTKEQLGRDKFMNYINDWYSEYKGTIINQFKRMGFSCDWDRLCFTMDEKNSRAVRVVFKKLYDKGYIYRGKRIVNWCSHCRSTISDAEVEFEEENSFLWEIKYKIENSNDFLTVATTRPETLFGDTAVAVNPNDERYKNLVGKKVVLPILNKLIPIISDEYVEMDFGTGVVKITPAHDPNDYEVGERHNLEKIIVMNDDGTMNELAGKYNTMPKELCRKKVVEELKELDLLVSIKPYTHNVGHCQRCHSTIEPLISSQWFVKMSELSKPAIEVVENNSIKFSEDQYRKVYLNWMKNIKDWCISRQLWSGHRIPIFTCQECGEVFCDDGTPTQCPKCHKNNFTQDEDTLDTWFSSALWPISTLGYPDITEDLKYFYPTDVLVTAREIIQLWVARMIFSGLEYMNDIPFSHVLINGIVLDEHGRKMSKSLGNGVDPLVIIEKYGVDSLRFSLFNGVSIGSDSKFKEQKVELARNFINKVWNASQFVFMMTEGIPDIDLNKATLSTCDKWILNDLNTLIKSVDNKFEKFDIGMACSEIYSFFWDKLCDYYIETTKPILYGSDETKKLATANTLRYVLKSLLKLLHPFIPYVTEKIYIELSSEETIMTSAWPLVNENFNFDQEAAKFQEIFEIVKIIRNYRAENKIADNKKIIVSLLPLKEKNLILENKEIIEKLALLSELKFVDSEEDNCLTFITHIAKIIINEKDNINIEEEILKLNAQIEFYNKEIARSNGMLANEKFVAKAPEKLVLAEKEKLVKNTELLNILKNKLEGLKK